MTDTTYNEPVERKRGLWGFCGLFAGFALGQGSLFVVQTWLLAKGELTAVASLGVAIAVLSLAQWTADWGGLVLLARHALVGGKSRAVWAANIARLLVAVPTVGSLAIFAAYYAPTDPFASGMLFGGLAVAPIWAFNISGLLDGYGESAFSGPLASLPWLTSSATVFVVLHESGPTLNAGVWVGGAYALGCALCVFFQYLLVRKVPTFRQETGVPTLAEVFGYLRQGASYAAGDFPTQLYGRLLIFIVAANLSQQMTGLYVYVRQILGGFAQALALIKRIEFRRLSSALANNPLGLDRIVGAQTVNLGASVLVFVTATAMLPFRHWLPSPFPDVVYYVAFFSAVLPAWALSATFEHVIILQNKMAAYAIVRLSAIVLSGVLIATFVQSFGLTFIAWIDVGVNLTQALLFARIATRS